MRNHLQATALSLIALAYLSLMPNAAGEKLTDKPSSSAKPDKQTVERAHALVNEALKQNSLGEQEKAIELCNEAIALNPECYGAFFERSGAYRALNQPQKALADLAQVMRSTNPKTRYLGHRARADVYFSLKRYQDAVDEFKAVEAEHLHMSDGMLTLRAECLMQLKKYPAAIADYTAAIRMKPRFAELLSARGHAYCKAGQLDKALADFNAEIDAYRPGDEAFGGNPKGFHDRAYILDLMGKKDLAAKDRERAAKLDHANFNEAPFRVH
jgi:tetratricopeptide (TPR) repeat protein